MLKLGVHRRIQDLRMVGTIGQPGDLFIGRLCLPQGAKVTGVTVTEDNSTIHVMAERSDPHAPMVERPVRIVAGPLKLADGEEEIHRDGSVALVAQCDPSLDPLVQK